jgi:long-subunit fatty acid transport protein
MNGHDNQVDPMRAIVFGLVAPGNIAGLPFAFGVGLHLPDDRVFRVRSLDQEQPRWEMYDNQPQRIYIAADLAIRPVRWLEIGGGMAFLANTRARLDISGVVDLSDANKSTLRHEVDADLTSGRYPQVGVRVLPTEKLRFGAVYRGEYQLVLDIDAHLDVQADLLGFRAPLVALIHAYSINTFIPRQVAVGGSWDATDELTVVADVTWVNWAAFVSPATQITASVEVDPRLPKAFRPETPAPTVIIKPEFQNRFTPRVGAEYRLPLGPKDRGHQLALRAGYFYERSPVPEQTGGTNFVDADRHAFSAGIGVKVHRIAEEFPGDLRLDVHGLFSWLPERVMRKDSAADLVGDYRAGGTIWSFGTTLSVGF